MWSGDDATLHRSKVDGVALDGGGDAGVPTLHCSPGLVSATASDDDSDAGDGLVLQRVNVVAWEV